MSKNRRLKSGPDNPERQIKLRSTEREIAELDTVATRHGLTRTILLLAGAKLLAEKLENHQVKAQTLMI